ncbi:MAG: hypothetical protein M1818_003685 [Claussenomyces sp. TS43310]|nr:MAG: hypothetical protein M1818_003685 [Claussenomyces sp. TS43310]
MAPVVLPVEREIDATTDVGVIWKAAICRYAEISTVEIGSAAGVNTVDEILVDIHERDTKFKVCRHAGSKSDRFRTLVSKSLSPIEKLSDIVSLAALTAVNSVSADYDKITAFFEDLDLYLNRLKILEEWIPPIPELEVAVAEVLKSVTCVKDLVENDVVHVPLFKDFLYVS